MRKTYLDYMKALGAILVILAHSISTYSETFKLVPRPVGIVGNLCYAVNASVFFVIAGYLCHSQKILPFYGKKITKILVPFVAFSLLKIAYTFLLNSSYAHSDTLSGILQDAFLYGRLYWFPYTLFIIFLTAPLFWHTEGKTDNIRLFAAVAATVAFAILNEYLSLTGKENSILLLQINNECKYMPFFLMGVIFAHADTKKLEGLLSKHIPVKLIVSAVLVIFSGYYLVKGLPAGDEVRVMWEQPFHIRLLMALPLMYIVYGISKLLPDSIKWLSLTGKRSLQILLFDSIFRTILYTVLSKFFEHQLWMIPVVMVSSIALTLLVCEVIKKVPVARNLVGI